MYEHVAATACARSLFRSEKPAEAASIKDTPRRNSEPFAELGTEREDRLGTIRLPGGRSRREGQGRVESGGHVSGAAARVTMPSDGAPVDLADTCGVS